MTKRVLFIIKIIAKGHCKGRYKVALKTLEKFLVPKMDGCACAGEPDSGGHWYKKDWVTNCEAQDTVYPLAIEAIELLKELI